MPNKDWYWDRFETNVIQGELDLDKAKTSALDTKVEGRQQYTDIQKAKYETDFIDQLYGTDNRAWAGEEAPRDDGTWRGRGEIGLMGSGRGGKGGTWENPEHATWGLDLVRDWTGKEHLKVGDTDHYKWQTKGKVDWAHYYDDNGYQKAFSEMKKEGEVSTKHGSLKSFLTADSGKAKTSLSQRVDFVSAAKAYKEKADNDDPHKLRTTWDNKYVDQFDPETAKPYTPTYLNVPDLWAEAKAGDSWEEPMTPMTVTKPAGLPSLDSIKRTEVKVPAGLKSWGEAKSAPTTKFQPGGQKSAGTTGA